MDEIDVVNVEHNETYDDTLSLPRDGVFSSAGKLPPGTPDLDLLSTGVAVYPGGKTRLGTPIIIFPAKGHLRLQTGTVSDSQLVDIIKFFISITAPSRRMRGFAFLADFRASTTSAFSVIVSAMNNLQTNHSGVVSVFLILMPRQKPLQKAMYKAMGIYKKRSFLSFGKRKPSSYVIPSLPHILLFSAMELREHVTEDQLPVDFSGTLNYNHAHWISFYKMMDANIDAIREVERKMPETESRLSELQDEELPKTSSETDDQLGRMRSVYEDALEYLGINEAIDETTHLFGICTAPERHASFISLSGNPHWKEYSKTLESMLQRLLADRKRLQELWKSASSRVEYNRQFFEYKKQTGESIKWIRDVAQAALRQPLKMAENLDEAEANRKSFIEQLYRPAIQALAHADNCVKKADGLSHAMSGAEAEDPLHFAVDTSNLLTNFRNALEKRRSEYDNLYNFYLNAGRTVRWYKRTLRHLPIQLAPRLHQSDEGPVHFSPQWTRAVHSYALRHPPPSTAQLKAMKETLDMLPPKPMKHQARLLLHRLDLLRRLLDASGPQIRAAEFREIVELHSRSHKGLHDSALKLNTETSQSTFNIFNHGMSSDTGATSTYQQLQANDRGKPPNELRREGTGSDRFTKPEVASQTTFNLPHSRGDHVARFLNDQVFPQHQVYSDITDGFSAPVDEYSDSREIYFSSQNLQLPRARSEHDFHLDNADYVPPMALYRPVSLAAMTRPLNTHLWDANIRMEERRQNELVIKEMERRRALLADAERSLRDSSSYLTDLDREEPQPQRRKKRGNEKRGVRSVKKRDSKRPTHHNSEPNIHYDWDGPDMEEDDEDDWADSGKPISDLETLLNHLHADEDPPGTEYLPDTHIGSRQPGGRESLMHVQRYDRGAVSGTSMVTSSKNSRYHYSQQPDDVLLF